MAGIGFELKKLFSRRGLFASFRAYGYAGIICTGPMLLGIVLLLGVMFLCDRTGAPKQSREFAPGQDASTMGETTIQTDFLPVIQNSENIYKVVSKEEAFEKYRFKQRKLTKLKETVHKFLQK